MDFMSSYFGGKRGGAESSRSLPFTTIESLSITQKESLDALKSEFPEGTEEELLGYLKFRNFRAAEAAIQYRSTLSWKGSITPTIADVAPFLRGPPDGCIFLLEDMKGNCARDIHGRPIIASVGMLYGSTLEMQMQMTYALRRSTLYSSKSRIHSNCTIIEVAPRKGATATFRFPDSNVKLLMEMQKQHFPGTLSSTTHFCGIPSAVTWAFTLCKPFMEKEAYDNMVLRPDFSHLSAYVEPENLLVEWGGTLKFNVEEYIAWRAKEEGVEHLLDTSIRRYDPSSADTSAQESFEAQMMTRTAADIFSSTPPPIHSGLVSKRGNGQGLFSNYKWKEKLLCVLQGGLLVYFDDAEITAANKVARVISLVGAYVESASSDKPNALQLITPGRNFLFACKSGEDLDRWKAVIQESASSAVLSTRPQPATDKTAAGVSWISSQSFTD